MIVYRLGSYFGVELGCWGFYVQMVVVVVVVVMVVYQLGSY